MSFPGQSSMSFPGQSLASFPGHDVTESVAKHSLKVATIKHLHVPVTTLMFSCSSAQVY